MIPQQGPLKSEGPVRILSCSPIHLFGVHPSSSSTGARTRSLVLFFRRYSLILRPPIAIFLNRCSFISWISNRLNHFFKLGFVLNLIGSNSNKLSSSSGSSAGMDRVSSSTTPHSFTISSDVKMSHFTRSAYGRFGGSARVQLYRALTRPLNSNSE